MKLTYYVMFILSFFMLLGITSPALAAEEYPQDIRTTTEEKDYSDSLVILHSNDVHGAIDGYAKMAALAEKYRKMGAEVLIVDAGDFSQGGIYVNLSNGMNAVKLMNAVGYNYATMGNHDFDYSQTGAAKIKEEADFTILCANLEKDGSLLYDPDQIFTAKNGVKIGLFGLDTPETMSKCKPDYVQGLNFYSGDELAECARKETKKLRDEGAELVIAMTHLGVSEESAPDKDRSLDIYKAAPDIDFIIDGHSHTVMTEGTNHEPIQSTGTKFAYIGVVIIDKDAKVTEHFLMDTAELPSDETVAAIAAEIKDEVDSKYKEVAGTSEVTLEGDRTMNRSRETNSGDFITDAMTWYVGKNSYLLGDFSGPLVTVVNGGAIRAEIAEGDVTKQQIFDVCPYGNTVYFLKIKGSELLEFLEASTFMVPDKLGGFPQTKGIIYTVDTTKSYDEGELYPNTTYFRPASINRVSIQSINGKAFDPDETYGIITTDFLADGGDVAYVFAGKESNSGTDPLDEILEDYLVEELDRKITKAAYGEVRGDLTIILPPAQTGWTEEDGSWYYYQEDGSKKTGWLSDNGKWYYLGADGVMNTGWIQDNGKWYYLGANGAMKTGWIQVKGKWYYLGANGAMKTGWILDKGTWYYLRKDGSMAESEWRQGCWLSKNGSWSYTPRASWHRDSKGWWYEDTSGWYAVNSTYLIDGVSYSFDAKGYCVNP